MPRVTGRVEVLLNGKLLLNKEGAVINGVGVSGKLAVELSPVMGDTGNHGFVEKPVEANCEVTVTDRDDISISELAEVRENGTIIFRTAGGGKVYVGEGATCTRNITITAGEGETPLKFIVPFWTESTQAVT